MMPRNPANSTQLTRISSFDAALDDWLGLGDAVAAELELPTTVDGAGDMLPVAELPLTSVPVPLFEGTLIGVCLIPL